MRIDSVLLQRQYNNSLYGRSFPGAVIKTVQPGNVADAAVKANGFYNGHIDRSGVELNISDRAKEMYSGVRKITENADGVVRSKIQGTGVFTQISGGNGTLMHENVVGTNFYENI